MGKACIALFALVAAAYAESDPWYGYALSACHNAYGAPVPCAAGRKKRAAEADPAVLYHPYALAAPAFYGAGVVTKPCTNVNGEKVDCALGHKGVATAHLVPFVYGRK